MLSGLNGVPSGETNTSPMIASARRHASLIVGVLLRNKPAGRVFKLAAPLGLVALIVDI